MFKSKKKKAIKTLSRQIEKIKAPGAGDNANMTWVMQTRSQLLE